MTTIVFIIAIVSALVVLNLWIKAKMYTRECNNLVTEKDNYVHQNMDEYFSNLFMDHYN